MKVGNIVLVGLIGWVSYELYKMHTLNATLSGMKNDVANLKAKIANISNLKVAGGNTPMGPNSAGPSASNNDVSSAPNQFTGWGWTQFVGQPVLTEIISPDTPDAISGHSTSYNSIFRKKSSAFVNQSVAPFTGWN